MPHPAGVDTLVEELRTLAAGQGFTSIKALRQENLVALGYRVAAPDSGQDSMVEGLRVALRAVIEVLRQNGTKLGSPKRYFPAHLVAEAALGIGRFTNDSQMDRRNDAAVTIEAAGTTFAKYEEQALREVAVLLVSHQDDPRALNSRLDGTISEVLERGEAAATKVRVDRTIFFDDAGRIVNFERLEVVRSNIEKLRSVAFWTEYYSDSSAGIIGATRVLNAALGRQQDSAGGHFTEIILEPPLNRGEERMFVVNLDISSKVQCVPRIRCIATNATLAARMTLQFDPRFTPQEVWWWTQIGGEFQGSPERTLSVSPVGYVSFLFTGIPEGRNYGLAWEWPNYAILTGG